MHKNESFKKNSAQKKSAEKKVQEIHPRKKIVHKKKSAI